MNNYIHTVFDTMKPRDVCIMMGYLNANIGEGADLDCWIENMHYVPETLLDTSYQSHGLTNITEQWNTSILDAKSRPGDDLCTHHILTSAKLRIKAFRNESNKLPLRY